MAAKTTDWRPGPTVCRCCLSEGCYKDISTEYFWMGKREVYSEMLSETLSLSIAYSTSGGPNSNSRLICEPCISRLRDASDFKRQVQECEKTFMQYLDPGSEPLSDFDETRIEVPIESLETQVKVEQVKTEKDDASDGDFEDRADFLDDDEDDLDDQPLTRLATKIPKKESVDLLDLLESKPAEKRKSTTKAKAGPAKKAKTKKEVVKATSSKATKQTEKKKKGDVCATTDSKVKVIYGQNKSNKESGSECNQQKLIGGNSTVALITSSNAFPFKWLNNFYLCFYCEDKFLNFSELEHHKSTKHQVTEELITKSLVGLGKYQKVKVNFISFECKLCTHVAEDYFGLIDHLGLNHKIRLNVNVDNVVPYRIDSDGFKCAVCSQSFHNYGLLNRHINKHFYNFVCTQCGVSFANDKRLKLHTQSHVNEVYTCELCGKVFSKRATMKDHVARIHMNRKKNKCTHCEETFKEYRQKIKHLVTVHGVKVPEFRCTMCPKVFSISGELKSHQNRIHFKIKNYECDLCQKRFVNAAFLRNHMVSHTGERNFECQVCKNRYKRKSALDSHMRIHNNDKRYVCQYCSKAFVQNCNLKSHVRTHHKDEVIT